MSLRYHYERISGRDENNEVLDAVSWSLSCMKVTFKSSCLLPLL